MTTLMPNDAEWRRRLIIHNADAHVAFYLKRDGSGAGQIVVVNHTTLTVSAVYSATDRQQRYYANEISALLMADEGSALASCDGIVAWLDNQLERA
jgi:hypothetical protein